MNKIIVGILAFLMWLMPWSGTIYGLHAQYSFDRNATMNKIATYVKARDVANLESMMRPWFKNNMSNLTVKLGEFYDAIDGSITDIEKGVEGSMNDGGIHSERLSFYVNMDDQTYYNLVIWYDVSNSKNRNEVGISSIVLSTGKLGPGYVIHFQLEVP